MNRYSVSFGGYGIPRRSDLERRDVVSPNEPAHPTVNAERRVEYEVPIPVPATAVVLNDPKRSEVLIHPAVEVAEPVQVGFREAAEVIHGRTE